MQDNKSITSRETPEDIEEPEMQEQPSSTNVSTKDKGSQAGGSRTSFYKTVAERDIYAIIKTPSQVCTFRPYMEYVDKIIATEILEAIKISIKYLKLEMENRLGHNAPLFEVNLALQIPNIIFLPSLDLRNKRYSFMTDLEVMIVNIYNMSDMIVMVAQPPEEQRIDEQGNIYEATFQLALEKNKEIEHMKADIITLAKQTIREAVVFANEFEKYAYIWSSDKKQCLEQFLTYGKTLSSEEMEALGTDTLQVCTFFSNKLLMQVSFIYFSLRKFQQLLICSKKR